MNKINNFVAKYAKKSGTGRHFAKSGPQAPRHRQEREWRREVAELCRN